MTTQHNHESRHSIVNATVQLYETYLHEPHRPPSRGGNTSALHVHYLTIGGNRYSFFARGSRKWVYQGDTVSFAYVFKDEKYRNIEKASVTTLDKTGNPVVRGDRRTKPTLRTTEARMPASRREQRD